ALAASFHHPPKRLRHEEFVVRVHDWRPARLLQEMVDGHTRHPAIADLSFVAQKAGPARHDDARQAIVDNVCSQAVHAFVGDARLETEIRHELHPRLLSGYDCRFGQKSAQKSVPLRLARGAVVRDTEAIEMRRILRHEQAAPLDAPDKALLLQLADGQLHGCPTQLMLLDESVESRQLTARGESASDDLVSDAAGGEACPPFVL